MNVTDLVRVLWGDSVGNAGALRNCRAELSRRRDAEREVEALQRRVHQHTERTDTHHDAATA